MMTKTSRFFSSDHILTKNTKLKKLSKTFQTHYNHSVMSSE